MPRPANSTVHHDPIAPHLDLPGQIERLKKQMNAYLLAHFYQEPRIQDVADSVGDSLQLARDAAATQADVIVFAGVHFMAETAKILNPDQTVLMPDLDAGCSLADACPPEAFARFRAQHPDHMVISYINCSAAIKAQSDLIVTSSNAERLVAQLPPDQPIIFAPDRNLGAWVQQRTGRSMRLWSGSCIVHEMFSLEGLKKLKVGYPEAPVLAHPECETPILELADHVGSTASIRRFVADNPATAFIIVTEPGLIHALQKDHPRKRFIAAPPVGERPVCECPHMRRNTLENLYLCMRDGRPQIRMDEDLRRRAFRPIQRMLEMSASI